MAEISKTADQALTVLLEVAERGPMTPATLARSLSMNRTVAHRLMATLHQRGFITRQEDGYVAGAVLVRLAESVQPELRARARATMRRLAADVGETIVLHIRDGGDAVVLDQIVPHQHVVRVQHDIGSRHPLALGASGRALLAFMDPPAAERTIRRSEDADALRGQLEDVRAAGYALSRDELQQGVHGLAVPVLDEAGHVVASLAILVPVTRASGLVAHADGLLDAAGDLARSLVSVARST